MGNHDEFDLDVRLTSSKSMWASQPNFAEEAVKPTRDGNTCDTCGGQDTCPNTQCQCQTANTQCNQHTCPTCNNSCDVNTCRPQQGCITLTKPVSCGC